ncbi:NlpC/P60 family protein [Escherichia coli]|uniref:NlpC/P60 family protein n=1 Tax=Escherichia coli TaxID=562 RepID=UPI00389112D9
MSPSSAQAGDVLLCCFGSSVPNHAAVYCGDGELLHHIPEQLSKRERYSEKWQRRTHSVWRHRHWHASAFTRGFTTIWPPPQPVCEHGSGSHSRPVDADAGLSPSDERRLVPDTYCR